MFNGSTSALGAFRVGSSPAIQTREESCYAERVGRLGYLCEGKEQ